MSGDAETLAKAIWRASRADESTISAIGAQHVARAVLASDWLAAHNAAIRAEALKEMRVEIVQQMDQPTTCKVWRHGRLVFDGQDRAAALRAPQPTEGES